MCLSDNSVLSLEIELSKLMTYLSSYDIKKIALEIKSIIFDILNIREFKQLYTDIQNKNQIDLKILLFKSPVKIENKNSI